MASGAPFTRPVSPLSMPAILPDPTFYPSPRLAAKAPVETTAYVAVVNSHQKDRPDAIATIDVDPKSPTYDTVVGRLEMPYVGDELHHFGWNACSSALCPYAPHPHAERRYLIVPGLRSSRIYVVDTKGDGGRLNIVKIIEPDEVADKTGYSRLHTVHCGPEGIYISALGAPDGGGPGGIFLLDHETFDIRGRWELDRGPQFLSYDFWWHLGHDVMLTSEWGTPNLIENGLDLDALMAKKYGRYVHVWDLRRRRHLQALDTGEENQLVLELRPAHDPTKAYGFVGVVVSLKDLSSSVFVWYKENGSGTFKMRKVIEIPAEPADPANLPPALKAFSAVPPLVSDIDLSVDDRFLYVSCWGTGEMRQYDVSDPFDPKLVGSVHIGGIVRRTPHPRTGEPLNGGPQMVEVSRDGKRVYFTNGLYSPWDVQFYPEGIKGWMVKLDVGANGGITADANFFVEFGEERAHQVRLQGGDASSDSYCYP
jgi:selenium-binding protein 1